MENDVFFYVIVVWEKGIQDVSDWYFLVLEGEGWFMGFIYDIEDGLVCVWFWEVK